MSKKNPSKCDCPTMSRRRFLASLTAAPLLGYSASPVAALVSTILAGQSQKAWADSLGLSPRRLLLISEFGGPAAYMFDQFLTPYSTTNFTPNAMVGTQFAVQNGRYIGTEYVTHAVKGINVATMWTHSVPAAGGGLRPLSQLLDNLLSVQGINTRSGGHGQSAYWANLPPGAKQSTPALAGDAYPSPFAALNLGVNYYDYHSQAGKTSVRPSMSGSGANNPLTKLLDPFSKVGSTTFKSKKADALIGFDRLWPMLDRLALSGHVGAQGIIQNRASAVELLNRNFGNLVNQWDALRSKYQDLVTRAIFDPNNPLVGFNDMPIGEGGTGDPGLYQVNGNVNYPLELAGDVRDVIDAATTIYGLAENFALTEFAFVNNLCGSIAMDIDGLSNLKNVMVSGGDRIGMQSDQHQTGMYGSMYFNCLRFRAMASCVLELIDRLKAINAFDDTVVRWGGEFIRGTRIDQTGSDHGWEGARYNFYSGKINGPKVIGTLGSALTGDYRNCWGRGDTVAELGRTLSLNDLAILTAHLIGVEAPLTSAAPIAILGSNGIVPQIALANHRPPTQY